MIEKARALYPDLRFVQGNARTHNGRYDVLFSNVCLQWVPDHRALLPHLMRCNLNEGGVLAVQMPMNGEEPLFRIIRETADNPRWGVGDAANEVNDTLSPDAYFDILSGARRPFRFGKQPIIMCWPGTRRYRMGSGRAPLPLSGAAERRRGRRV